MKKYALKMKDTTYAVSLRWPCWRSPSIVSAGVLVERVAASEFGRGTGIEIARRVLREKNVDLITRHVDINRFTSPDLKINDNVNLHGKSDERGIKEARR